MQKDKHQQKYLPLTKPPVKSAAHLRKDPRARFLTTGGICTTAADAVLYDITNIREILMRNVIVIEMKCDVVSF